MDIKPKTLSGLFDVRFDPKTDHRGYLSKPFDEKPFHDAGIDVSWKQIILQFTERKNTVKGFHVQCTPFTEAKLIIPLAGEVLWVTVDVRKESPTYGKTEATHLNPDSQKALFAARGFAHGCLNFTDGAHLLIAADNPHSDDHGVGFAWNDPEIGFDWPLIEGEPIIIKDEHRDNPPFDSVKDKIKL